MTLSDGKYSFGQLNIVSKGRVSRQYLTPGGA